MYIVIKYITGKHRGKYVKEDPSNPYWDEVAINDATRYNSISEANNKIDTLCAKVGDELPLKAVMVD
jgi:hypothetical protein